MPKYYKPNQATLLYLNTSYNCVKSSSVTLANTSGGSGYTTAPTITVSPASGDAGYGASATCTISSGAISTVTMVSNGTNYNKLPIVTISGGGSPGVITGYTSLVGGSGYITAPTLTVTGGGGSGFSGYCVLNTQTLNSTTPITIGSGGTGYTTGQSLIFTGGGGTGAVGTITATSGAITGVTITNYGTGFTSAPIVSVSGAGSGAVLTANLSGASIASLVISNGGSGYTTAPTFVFTVTSGGSGASATPTVNLGTSAVITPSFVRTYSFTWNVPDININDLGKISVINLVASGFTTTTPYTFRIMGLQVDSRNSFYSDYSDPIITMVQNTNIANNNAINSECSVFLSPQTIRQIQLSVSDSLITLNNGIVATLNFMIALKIEEFDPTYTEIGDVYGEGASRIKTLL
jgi:hypothetical protein